MKPNPCSRRGEAGSAYIITLLALVVLTILALSLALVTQTEVQIGANEKTINRTFYATDSGLGIAAAEVLASRRYTTVTVFLNRSVDAVTGVTTADRVTILPIVPFPPVRCDWCPANDDGTPKFWKVNHLAHAVTERVAWDSTTPTPPPTATVLAHKTLSAMFEFEPFPSPPPESLPEGAALQALQNIK